MNNQSLDQSIDVLSKALKDLSENKTSTGDLSGVEFLNFKAEKGKTNAGKGIIFTGSGNIKQLILTENPERFFSSESIDLDKHSAFMIDRVKVLDSEELGPGVTRSSLREVGRLRGLIVDGSVSINQHLFYDGSSDRLGLGTEQPNAALSIMDNGIEIIVGNKNGSGVIGTFGTSDFDLVSGSKSFIKIKPNGAIDIGNPNANPSTVKIYGKLSIGVAVPDSSVDLHVAGSARLNNRLHGCAEAPPNVGNYNVGDIIWNSTPRSGKNIGWVCTRAGSPGEWNQFGNIQ